MARGEGSVRWASLGAASAQPCLCQACSRLLGEGRLRAPLALGGVRSRVKLCALLAADRQLRIQLHQPVPGLLCEERGAATPGRDKSGRTGFQNLWRRGRQGCAGLRERGRICQCWHSVALRLPRGVGPDQGQESSGCRQCGNPHFVHPAHPPRVLE